MDKTALDLWRSKNLAEKPAYHWNSNNKTPKTGVIEENKRNSFTLPALPFPQSSTAQCQDGLSLPWFLPWGKVNMWVLSFSTCVGGWKTDSRFSHPIQNTEVCSVAGRPGVAGRIATRGTKGCGSYQQRCGLHQEFHLWLWWMLACGSQLAHGHPQWSKCLTYTHQPIVARSLGIPPKVVRETLKMATEHCIESQLDSAELGETIDLGPQHQLRDSKREALSTKPDLAGSIQGI